MSDEWLYHVDAQDHVLGRVSRARAHTEGILHRAGCVFVTRAPDLVYLAHRAPTRSLFAGCLDLPCSFHVTYGESYAEAAIRELWEETGIRGRPERLGHVVVGAPDPMHVEVFTLAYEEGEVQLDPGEAVEGAWWTRERARARVRSLPCTSWLERAWGLWDV